MSAKPLFISSILIGALKNMKDTQKCVSFLRLCGCFGRISLDFEALQALLSIVLKTKLVSKLVSQIGKGIRGILLSPIYKL